MKRVENLLHLDWRTEKSNRGLHGHGDPSNNKRSTITSLGKTGREKWQGFQSSGPRGDLEEARTRWACLARYGPQRKCSWGLEDTWGKTEKEKYLGFSLFPFCNRLPGPQTQPESLNIQPEELASLILWFDQEHLKCQIWWLWGQIGYRAIFFFLMVI